MGTAANPTNYWLSVTAGNNIVAFGWRTSEVHHGDDAVFGHLTATGAPAGDWQELFDPQVSGKSLDLAFALTTTPATPPPPPPPPGKWVQYPDLTTGFGLDVNATRPNSANGLLTLADDFQCTVVGPITNIQLWASLQGDAAPAGHTFVVSIWSDAPKSAVGFSQPKQRLWSQTYGPTDYTVTSAGSGTEHFYDPTTQTSSPETAVWLYSFNLFPTNPFCQQGQGLTYWVSVAALTPTGATTPLWGWKTSTNHWQDAGVFGILDPVSALPLVPWQPLYNPLLPAAPIPVDFAFQINSGPPSTDCDPALGGVIQPPDTSPNGMDVDATTPNVVGDDFLCRISRPISGFSIWGSWLNDMVDTNAQFVVTLWSDVPALPGVSQFSHPGSMICSAIFQPPQTLGAALRYQYGLYKSGLQETFYNPALPGTSGLIGTDTQIWRYDFFPFVPSCFLQAGDPFSNSKFYWVTVSYLPGTVGANQTLFGWKTSTTHFQDAAVLSTDSVTWQPLSDPRTGTALDLAKIVWKFRVTGKNEDIYNLTGSSADEIQIVLKGTHLVTWHYDDSPPWTFNTSFTAAGDTVLQWTGRTISPGGLTHIGYETPGTTLPTVLSMNWLAGGAVIGPIVQQNYHLLGDPVIVMDNDFYPGPIVGIAASVEVYDTPPPLDQMVVGGSRSPLATFPLPNPGPCPAGGSFVMLNPQPLPPKSMYELILVDLADSTGQPAGRDFVLLPLDTEMAPAVQSIGFSGGNVVLHIDSDIGHSYQLQSSMSITNPFPWTPAGDPVMATGPDTILTAPMTGAQSFFRVMLMP